MKKWIVVFLALLLISPFFSAVGGAQKAEMVLNIARGWEKDVMDPATWSTNEDLAFGPNVFQNLLTYDDDLNFVGSLAEQWETSDDNLTYRFFLRKGVQFHYDYGEMKASDVVFSFERLNDPELNASYIISAVELDNIAEITAEDDYTIKITLKEEDITFLYKIAGWYVYIVSEKAVKELGNDGFAMKPVGTGPFQFDKGTPAEKTEVVRHEKYWGDKAIVDRLVFHIITEPATLFSAFETGEIDLMSGLTDMDKLLEYRANPDKYYIDSTPSRQLLYVGLNYQDKYFSDQKVRDAFSYAIDRDEIIRDFYMGLEQPAGGFIPEMTKYAVTDYWHPVYDLEKAKELLKEAGYPNGIETEFYCPDDHLSMGPATVVQSYLTQAGIKAALKAVDFGIYIDAVRNGTAPIWLLYNSTGVLPDETLKRYTSAFIPGNNWCSFNDPEYDKLVAEAIGAKTEDAKREASIKAQERLLDAGILYSICTYTEHTAMQSNIKGFKLGKNLVNYYDRVYIE